LTSWEGKTGKRIAEKTRGKPVGLNEKGAGEIHSVVGTPKVLGPLYHTRTFLGEKDFYLKRAGLYTKNKRGDSLRRTHSTVSHLREAGDCSKGKKTCTKPGLTELARHEGVKWAEFPGKKGGSPRALKEFSRCTCTESHTIANTLREEKGLRVGTLVGKISHTSRKLLMTEKRDLLSYDRRRLGKGAEETAVPSGGQGGENPGQEGIGELEGKRKDRWVGGAIEPKTEKNGHKMLPVGLRRGVSQRPFIREKGSAQKDGTEPGGWSSEGGGKKAGGAEELELRKRASKKKLLL